MGFKREQTTVTFDGAVLASGQPMQSRDVAIEAGRRLWADSIVDQRPDWSDEDYLRGMVELLAEAFGSPFEGEVDWDTVKDWYAFKLGGAVPE